MTPAKIAVTSASAVATLGAILGAFLAIDSRYAHAEDAKKQVEEDKKQEQASYAALQLQIYQNKAEGLKDKGEKRELTEDEKSELTFARKMIDKLREAALDDRVKK
jgi:hypothetical protein